MSDEIKCEYCGKILKEDDLVNTNEFLTGVFGYVYCSKECLENHINSK